MKVKCIDNHNYYLTIDKTYEIISENDILYWISENNNWYWIIDDNGKEDWYPKNWFKPLSEIRNDKIDKLLGL